MASNVDNGFSPVTLAVYRAPADTTGPTGATGAPAGFTDMGALSLDDGYEFTPVGAGDKTVTKAFANGGEVFFTSRSTSDDLPTWKFSFLETNKEVIEFVFGVTVDADGSYTWKNAIRDPEALVIDLIDGKGNVQRDFIPAAAIASVDAITSAGTDRLTKYVVTIEGDASSVLDGGAYKRWLTSLADVTP